VARTAFGGSMSGALGRVTIALVVLNVIGSALELILGGPANYLSGFFSRVTEIHFIGAVYGSDVYLGPDGRGYTAPVDGSTLFPGIDSGTGVYRLFTSMFIHYGPLHVLMNMYAVWQLGRYLEAQIGPVRYLALYLLSGLGGGVAAYLFQPNGFTAGASGAVFGLFAAVFILLRRLGRDTSSVLPVIIINLVLTFSIPGISIAGHLGGMVTGGVLALGLAYAPQQNREVLHTATFAVVGLGLAGLTGLAILL
jgi:membrane associated rhomboid family serine protease